MPLPVRKRAAGNMAGAIFMCNITSRDQCMEAGVFGLPMVYYEHLVSHVKQGMRLFLFEKDLHKLYGVYEAASDGGLHIKKDGFHHAFPAQVRICIVRNCRPLSEEEFAPAIRDNYYLKETFYFDLPYNQVVRLCKLFGCQNYMEHRSSGKQDCSKPDMEGGSSDDESSFMFPQTQALANRYSSHTSMPTGLPPGVLRYR